MFQIRLSEIPEGHSSKTIRFGGGDHPFVADKVIDGVIQLQFNRQLRFVQVDLEIEANVQLVCDRSLESFIYTVKQPYHILFKADSVEESSDHKGSIRNINTADNSINLELDIRDTILVNIPIRKIHPSFLDENGNPIDMEPLQFGSSDADGEIVDPRWNALKNLKD